jgi:Metal binding domain of Ada
MLRLCRSLFAVLLLAVTFTMSAETYRGNTNSHVFHRSGCRHYACKNCTVKFASADEAVQRGFRPCSVCEPGGGGGGTTSAQKTAEGYSGNTSSRKFHRASCRHASCANCTAKFRSRQAAIDAGYVPGGCCKP